MKCLNKYLMYRLPLHYTYIIRTCYIRHTLIVIHCTIYILQYTFGYTQTYTQIHIHIIFLKLQNCITFNLQG